MKKQIWQLLYRYLKLVFGRLKIEEMSLLRPIQYYVLKQAREEKVSVNGYTLHLDNNDSLKLSVQGLHEPFETNLFKKYIKRGQTVVDIGANIGYYSLLFSTLVGPSGQVFAFEPEKTNYSLLKKNIKINSVSNVQIISKAISNKKGRLNLYFSENNSGAHSLVETTNLSKGRFVETITLDNYFKNNSEPISLIKMDIQGAEYKALEGMKSIIKKSNTLILVTEYWPIGLSNSGVDPEQYIKTLNNLGFKIHEIQRNKKRLVPTTLERLSKKYPATKSDYTDLFCLKEN